MKNKGGNESSLCKNCARLKMDISLWHCSPPSGRTCWTSLTSLATTGQPNAMSVLDLALKKRLKLLSKSLEDEWACMKPSYPTGDTSQRTLKLHQGRGELSFQATLTKTPAAWQVSWLFQTRPAEYHWNIAVMIMRNRRIAQQSFDWILGLWNCEL